MFTLWQYHRWRYLDRGQFPGKQTHICVWTRTLTGKGQNFTPIWEMLVGTIMIMEKKNSKIDSKSDLPEEHKSLLSSSSQARSLLLLLLWFSSDWFNKNGRKQQILVLIIALRFLCFQTSSKSIWPHNSWKTHHNHAKSFPLWCLLLIDRHITDYTPGCSS